MASTTAPSPGQDYLVVDSPYEVANWRPLAHWAMFIPHAIILYALGVAQRAVFFVYWVIFVFTGNLNQNLYGFMVMIERYNTRAGGFLIGYTETYAPFDFAMGAADNEAYPPIRLDLPEPQEDTSRWAALNWLLAVPHYIVIALIAIAAVVALVIAWFAVLFTGAWPQGMRDFLVRFSNYYLRVWTYVSMADTAYPRFGL